MRIIAGKYGSRNIETLKGMTTRPTSDKVRSAIFSKIGPYFNEERFLDVFGGSGAMSLEALSRGMNHVTILEKDSRAAKMIQKNINTFKENENCQIIKGDSLKILEQLPQQFDYVFIDPPYAYEHTEEIIGLIIENRIVEDTGLIIVETDLRYDLPETILNFSCVNVKKYSKTIVRYYEKG